jgi:hypothetical protein
MRQSILHRIKVEGIILLAIVASKGRAALMAATMEATAEEAARMAAMAAMAATAETAATTVAVMARSGGRAARYVATGVTKHTSAAAASTRTTAQITHAR